jgi:hypothetical protein
MCTPLDAVQLCSEYIGERLVIAMSPITQTDGNLDILTIGFDKKKVLTLGNVSGGPGAFWSSKTEFIFRKL